MLELTTQGATCLLVVRGDLDVVSRDAFPEALLALRDVEAEHLVLDLCGCDFLDGTGGGFVADLARAARARGLTAVVRGADDRALFVLDVVGALDDLTVDEQHWCPEPSPDGDSVLDGAGIELHIEELAGSLPGLARPAPPQPRASTADGSLSARN